MVVIMGCDIHPVIEVLQDGYWIAVAIPDRRRCYPLFAALAGVRAGGTRGEPLSDNRGLPIDIGFGSSDLLSGEHSQGYATLAEMKRHPVDWLGHLEDWPRKQWRRWIRTMAFFRMEYEVTDEEVRVVFDFDS